MRYLEKQKLYIEYQGYFGLYYDLLEQISKDNVHEKISIYCDVIIYSDSISLTKNDSNFLNI